MKFIKKISLVPKNKTPSFEKVCRIVWFSCLFVIVAIFVMAFFNLDFNKSIAFGFAYTVIISALIILVTFVVYLLVKSAKILKWLAHLFSIPFVFLWFALSPIISPLIKKMNKHRMFIMKSLGIAAVVVYIIFLNVRINNIERRFGGATILRCSPAALQNLMNQRVVRIEGKYSEGSGFPISKNEIFTNFHVIDGDPSPKVVFPDGSIETPVKIVGDKQKDMAVLTLNRKLTPLSYYGPMGTSKTNPNPTFGEPLYAVGFAEGSELKGGVTINNGSYNGVVYENSVEGSFIQTGATLVQGMSGGPLVDACGEVIGANTMGLAGLSMFIDVNSIENSTSSLSDKDVAKISVDTSTPVGIVNAYYTYIGARDLKDAYNLVSPGWLNGTTFDYWTEGYATTLQVGLISSKPQSPGSNRVMVKLFSLDWINGTVVEKYYEGFWNVSPDLKLGGDSFKVVENPGLDWFSN